MKNIQIIDGALNCVYDIFSATEDEFNLIFKKNTDIAFIDEIYSSKNLYELDLAFAAIWKRRVKKSEIFGIHGTIFFELNQKKIYYPTRKDEEARNPDNSKLR